MQQNDRILRGCAAIAEYLGPDWTDRQVFHLVSTKKLPVFKIGGKWCARVKTLDAYIDSLDTASAA